MSTLLKGTWHGAYGIAIVTGVLAYFLSDLHISSCEEPKGVVFIEFLKGINIESVTHLFLMGDVFDLWIGEHKYFLEKFEPIVSEIRRLQQLGLEIHYFEGNHDLYLEDFWGQKLGVHVHSGPIVQELGPWKLGLEHGDEIDRMDRGYIALRWFLRCGLIRWLLCHAPSSLVAKLGDRVSRASRYYTSQVKVVSNDAALEKVRAHARQWAKSELLDYVITGHFHIRDEMEVGEPPAKALSVNLGSWLDEPKYFRLSDQKGQFQLL